MLFSVIIPTFNRRRLLQCAVESVLQQTLTGYEVLVVDDGSTDATKEYLATLGDRVRVFMQSNQGPGAARNLGAFQARGDYIAFLDSDDVWFPWTLEIYAEILGNERKPAFIAGKPFVFCDDREVLPVSIEPVQIKEFPDYLASGDEWRWWGASSFVVQKDTFGSVGGFPNQWINGEDADLALRLGVAHGFIQICAPFTFGYRKHPASAMKDLDRTVAGASYKVLSEQAGGYPGGQARERERLRILTRHIRPVALECLRRGMRSEAWKLYRATLRWHCQLRRWKFLLGFPLRACLPRR